MEEFKKKQAIDFIKDYEYKAQLEFEKRFQKFCNDFLLHLELFEIGQEETMFSDYMFGAQKFNILLLQSFIKELNQHWNKEFVLEEVNTPESTSEVSRKTWWGGIKTETVTVSAKHYFLIKRNK